MRRKDIANTIARFCNHNCPISRDRCEGCPIHRLEEDMNKEHETRQKKVSDSQLANLKKRWSGRE